MWRVVGACRDQRLTLGVFSSITLHLIYWVRITCLNPTLDDLTSVADQLVPGISSPCLGLEVGFRAPSHLHGCWGSEHRSLCLHDKCFMGWAISPNPCLFFNRGQFIVVSATSNLSSSWKIQPRSDFLSAGVLCGLGKWSSSSHLCRISWVSLWFSQGLSKFGKVLQCCSSRAEF